jgi:error-prone DNA polymerase
VRVGLRYVVGLRKEAARRIEAEQARLPFSDPRDFQRRCRLRENELNALAELGAFASLGLRRREALWQVSSLYTGEKGLLTRIVPKAGKSPLAEMTPKERTAADYKNSALTTGPHPLAHLRKTLRARGVLPAASLAKQPDGRRVKVAGVVITRQRPQTARGMCFITLEDESGLCNIVITPDRFEQNRRVLVTSSALIVEGRLERRDGVTNLRGQRFEALTRHGSNQPSRDFR